MKKQSLTSLAIASTFAAVALTPVANAADNPFAAKQLSAGYQLAQADTKGKEGKCGEGKCGAEKKSAEKKKDGKCGEGKCGGDKKAADKKKDGKCGEGKCGAAK
ncbi:MAG: hypothetical protein RBS35_08095 [Azonexus sp.]|nr:hypothetical protein [Azonexus sp.]